jgi:hypothetical protein
MSCFGQPLNTSLLPNSTLKVETEINDEEETVARQGSKCSLESITEQHDCDRIELDVASLRCVFHLPIQVRGRCKSINMMIPPIQRSHNRNMLLFWCGAGSGQHVLRVPPTYTGKGGCKSIYRMISFIQRSQNRNMYLF